MEIPFCKDCQHCEIIPACSKYMTKARGICTRKQVEEEFIDVVTGEVRKIVTSEGECANEERAALFFGCGRKGKYFVLKEES